MPNPDEWIENFCKEIVNYLTQQRQSSPDLSEEPSEQVSAHTLTLVKKTQLKVSEKIGELIESGEDKERLLNLYVIDSYLYELRHKIDQQERRILKILCSSIENSLQNHLKTAEIKRQGAKDRLEKRLKWNNQARVLCYIIGTVCVFLGFSDPVHVGIYFSITLVCLTQIFLLGDFWISGAKAHKEKVYEINDPKIISSALNFLNTDHLFVLLEPPCFAPDYQERFMRMLIHLTLSFHWMPKENIEIEDLMENSKAALEEAYSTFPVTYDPVLIKKWRIAFEEIQGELHHHFGESLYNFNTKIKTNPDFYLEKFSQIKSSETGRKTLKFLKKTKYL